MVTKVKQCNQTWRLFQTTILRQVFCALYTIYTIPTFHHLACQTERQWFTASELVLLINQCKSLCKCSKKTKTEKRSRRGIISENKVKNNNNHNHKKKDYSSSPGLEMHCRCPNQNPRMHVSTVRLFPLSQTDS